MKFMRIYLLNILVSATSSDLWLPNSPDLNPVDYKIWAVMQYIVYQTKVKDLESGQFEAPSD